MVVRRATCRCRRVLIALGLSVLTTLAALPALAQSAPTLTDAWIETLQGRSAPPAWSHAFALRQETAAELPGQRRRMIEELRTLIASATIAGDMSRTTGLLTWQARLEAMDDARGRTPGRMDLPWLGAHLRHNPPLSTIAGWGVCEVPGWVELWHVTGVTRLAWRPGLTLDEALQALPEAARRDSNHAQLITPPGEVHRLGIAAWNAEPAPLAPGSRVMLEFPAGQGLRGALPFPGTVEERQLVNTRLPAYLATRLPGDDCRLWRAE
ncbi:MAG: capsule biosynthesis GfcC family protein [Halomonas sp.]|uniref:capsule biosynthesis GfcC family protein n=1 Tax=Halomonas sp. TaxID=1486246 RepID=UPI002ACE9B39|nr:capsule biosynthesis GfcC family protein [Halomonas sp.]MDZ7852536.1 capsule biosynthesis GfcC family protein [Halomonas sp.]